METEKDLKGDNWYSRLMSGLTTLADRLELESEQREELRAFVVDIAKSQYAVGNKSGIRWLRVQLAKEQRGAEMPA